ncbi:sensor histidine kinase KdpD [Duganella sp. Root198D2]|uniref:sensor histidine kinase n=1 Tax=Duganella sp. Root198D2 TaxID=1736489 RepID=UPI001E420333|nr:histidine kinase dimerization/phospho-acceptor domain-containing protein [Duganella sp. Root198D2]
MAGQLSAAVQNAGAAAEQRQRAEALAELDRVKTAFFSNVSHEFRTPLTLMPGPIEEALNDGASRLPAAHHARLQLAQRNALRLQKLVNTLLDFSRVQAGRVHAGYARVDLAALTRDLASGFRSVIESADMLPQLFDTFGGLVRLRPTGRPGAFARGRFPGPSYQADYTGPALLRAARLNAR